MPGTLLETRVIKIHMHRQTASQETKRERQMNVRINDADVPRQRPSTPEEKTIDCMVERMAPCLTGQRKVRLVLMKTGRADFVLSEASPC